MVDNPPFSILAKIEEYYLWRGIRFLLFAPTLTMMPRRFTNLCSIVTAVDVTFENGAVISISFVTDLEPDTAARTAPDLVAAMEKADRANRAKKTKPLYRYPDNVISTALMAKLTKVHFRVPRREARLLSSLDSQKSSDKTIFGGGLLCSDRVAAEFAAAREQAAREQTVWELSPGELRIIAQLNRAGERAENADEESGA